MNRDTWALDMLMNCSRGEGFGLATVEAQACGTPALNILIPVDLYEELRQQAFEQRQPMAVLVRKALAAYLTVQK